MSAKTRTWNRYWRLSAGQVYCYCNKTRLIIHRYFSFSSKKYQTSHQRHSTLSVTKYLPFSSAVQRRCVQRCVFASTGTVTRRLTSIWSENSLDISKTRRHLIVLSLKMTVHFSSVNVSPSHLVITYIFRQHSEKTFSQQEPAKTRRRRSQTEEKQLEEDYTTDITELPNSSTLELF